MIQKCNTGNSAVSSTTGDQFTCSQTRWLLMYISNVCQPLWLQKANPWDQDQGFFLRGTGHFRSPPNYESTLSTTKKCIQMRKAGDVLHTSSGNETLLGPQWPHPPRGVATCWRSLVPKEGPFDLVPRLIFSSRARKNFERGCGRDSDCAWLNGLFHLLSVHPLRKR